MTKINKTKYFNTFLSKCAKARKANKPYYTYYDKDKNEYVLVVQESK